MKILSMSAKALLVLSLCFTSFAFAQDDEGGPQTQGDDAVYGRVVLVKFKPGMRADAMQIIGEHFMPAGNKAGLPAPWAFHFQTGDWDAAFTWKLEGGMKDLEWYTSPNNIKFMESLAEQEGGVDAANALWAKYYSMVADSKTDVGHWHEPKDDK
jgi:hypothetical protein